jgi:tRNA-specific 2-thiouridylase
LSEDNDDTGNGRVINVRQGRYVKVVAAMSGGVDSSVAAALLKEEGYQVIGITMQVWPSSKSADESGASGGCCGLDAVADAKRVAYRLGIPHHVVDFRDVFARKVVDHFCQEYSLGRTPNPCIRCNQFVKFDSLLRKAKELDAGFVATGHYARIEKEASGRCLLKKGTDKRKDQSYFLYVMTQEQLSHSLFPLGDLTKERVRRMAGEFELPVTDKSESQDICFIPGNDYTEFLKEYVAAAVKPGQILDGQGNVLGQHRGIIHYTIGQRKGLGVSAREPLYVLAINHEENAVIVGGKDEVYSTELTASEINWIATEVPEQPVNVSARIRYLHREAAAVVTPLGEDRAQVKFKEPQMAITPGQAVVFYDGDTVIGGGSIESVVKGE